MMNSLIRNTSRILSGLVFVFSGFVKGVDPLGTAYRIEDYFIAYGTDWALSFSLLLSIVLCAVEFSVGMALLANVRMKLTSWVLLLMMSFFTLLTFYDALYEPVPDCGCFGDAIKMTNWQTFYKNIVLIMLALLVFVNRNKYQSLFSKSLQTMFVVLFLLLFGYFSVYNYRHLPMIDFRAWKVGNQLNPDGEAETKVYLLYQNKQSGETQEYLSPNYPWNDSVWLAEWEFIDQRTETNGDLPQHGLFAEDADGNDMTDVVLHSPHLFVFVSPALEEVDSSQLHEVDDMVEQLQENGYAALWLTASLPENIEPLLATHNALAEVYFVDETVLKTIVRANPGLVLIHQGEVLGKWHYNDFPQGESLLKILHELNQN